MYPISCHQVQGCWVAEFFLGPSLEFCTGCPELAAQPQSRTRLEDPAWVPARLTAVPLLPRSSAVCCKVDQNTEELQEARCSKKKLESKMFKATKKPKESEPKVGLRERKKVRESRAAARERERQVEPEGLKASRGHRLTTCAGAGERQLPTGDPGVVFLKTHHGDPEQLEVADQWIWFEGLPTRIHLPGPRVMCRPSTLRWVKRCCTRFCSASLELPMCHPYRV